MDYLVTSTGATLAPAPAPSLAVPETVRQALTAPGGLDAAERYTRKLAMGHYENFSVLSVLLPRHLRQDFSNVYAFCRTADDLSDETRCFIGVE